MHSSPRLAIIEDHPLMREALEHKLEAVLGGHEITYSGASLTDAITATSEGRVDCAILDLDLGDGSSATSNVVRLVEAGCRVLIVSAFADPTTVRAALRAGALGFVSKGAPVDDLTTCLRATLADEPSTSRDVAEALLSDESSSVALSERERTALVLYASGLKIESVARHMGVKPSTAQEYIKRVREKYLRVGTHLPSKMDLYRQAKDEGLVP